MREEGVREHLGAVGGVGRCGAVGGVRDEREGVRDEGGRVSDLEGEMTKQW